jgi:PAS domain S-box-containing protein
MAENTDRSIRSELAEGQVRNGHPCAMTATSRTWLTAGDIMSEDVATVNPSDSVVSAAEIMSTKNISCVIVSEYGNLSGIVSETDILKKATAGPGDLCGMKVEQIMSSPIRSVPRDLSVMEIGEMMEVENIRRLVVLDDGQSVGVITQTDMVRVLASYTLSKDVSEIMTNDVAVIPSSASVKEAAELMACQNISCLVAMDNDAVVGIFTERDHLKRVIATKRDPHQTSLKDVMTSPVVTIPSNYSVLSAQRQLEKTGIRRLVVTDFKTLCGIVTQTDILKAIKANLQEEEVTYFRLLSESSNCIYTIDLDFNTTYVNPALMKLLDVTDSAELINQPFLPERFWDDPRERDRFLDYLGRTGVEVKELILRTAKGRKLFVTLFSTCIKNIKGEISGSQGVLYDVTAEKELVALREAQQQLRESEDLLIGTLESTADGILVVDEKGQVTHTNRRFAKMWGISGELARQPDAGSLLGHIGSRLNDGAAFLARLQAPHLTQGESSDTLILKEGTVLEVHSLPLIRKAADTGRVWSFQDITEHKQTAEALRKLEVRVEQRTAELSQANEMLEAEIAERKRVEHELEKLNMNLESSVRKLNRSNKELQEFAHITAHDLKTPLRGIGILADWLVTDYADKFDEKGKEQVRLLAARATQISALIDSVLEYSMIRREDIKKQQIDLNTVIPELIARVDPPADVEITIENELPALVCERTHIVQVFQNLLSNAIKYMDKPKGQVKVGCVGQGDFWKFSVADNGPGIDSKYFDKIFRMFQTLSPRDEVESTGIGLSIVKKIAELNGGKVWVESEVGKGSTFFFTLPEKISDGAAIVADMHNQETSSLGASVN